MSLTEWTNTPNLQWVNTIQEWSNIEVLITFIALATFIAEAKTYLFLASDKAYFIEANNKP